MSHDRVDNLRLSPSWSRQLLYWLVCAHAVGAIAAVYTQTTFLIKILLLLVLTLNFIQAVRRYLFWEGRFAVREAWVSHDGGWHLMLGNGETMQVRLLADSFIKPWLVVLRFKSGRYTPARSMVLFPDSLDESVNRKLRIYLKRTAQGSTGVLGE